MNWYSITKLADSLNSLSNEDLWEQIRTHGPRKSVRLEQSGEEYGRRRHFTSHYSWAVPSREALEKLKNWLGGNRIIEVGAGRGLWARLLRGIGVSVEASDVNLVSKNEFLKKNLDNSDDPEPHTWTEVSNKSGEHHAKEGSGGDALMMVWPYMDTDFDWQREALLNFGGDKLIIVGEGSGGATGSTGLWDEVDKNWTFDDSIDIPRWQGMHDYIQLYKRK